MADTTSNAVPEWAAEESYWRDNYKARPYIGGHPDFAYWSPAYRYGYDSARRFRGHRWNEVENDLRIDWTIYEHRGATPPAWDDIKDAVRDSWDRITDVRD